MSRRALGWLGNFAREGNSFPVRLPEAFAPPVPQAVGSTSPGYPPAAAAPSPLRDRREERREMEGDGAEREPGEEAPAPVFRVCPIHRMPRAGGGQGGRGNSGCAANPALVF